MLPLLALLALAVPARTAAQAPAQPRAPGEGRIPRTISVTGEGRVTAAPDVARARVGVLTEARTARTASDENARKMAAVVDALRKAGIPREKVQTVQLTIEPVYDYNQPEGRQVLRGFQARNVVEAQTPELGKLGQVLDAVIQVGGNTVEGITFELGDPGAAQARAMAQAIEDARRKAQALAKAAGVELGEVQEISAVQAVGPLPLLSRPGVATMEARAEAAPPPVSPGELTVTATVQVVYRLE